MRTSLGLLAHINHRKGETLTVVAVKVFFFKT